ncbi:MAG TPA: phenylalanine--tRNA ligase subunit alpha [Candidatus Peribacterales bacterium]|nr:phenylalanine--tRNA ligase subunit alpha [Candidatus Peribacterales bacterium]
MDLPSLQQDGLRRITSARSSDELFMLEKEFFGRKSGFLTEAMKLLKDLSPEDRKKKGEELNDLKVLLESALVAKRGELEGAKLDSLKDSDALDLTMDLPESPRGHLHLIPEFIRHIEEVFGRMGFDVAYGPEIDSEEYNFDRLNFPREHAARDNQDIFYMKNEGEPTNRMLLRGHTSTVQIRYAEKTKPPFRMICPGKVFRKDADATHSPMFHQFEGMVVGKDISLRHMKGVMITALKELVSPDLEFRFRTGYFPFVEPGLEMDVRWRGGKETKEGRWLEVVGCGVTHPNVLKACHIDPEKWQGFAFGFGVERLLMIKHQIPNIKLFYQGDLRFLKQF